MSNYQSHNQRPFEQQRNRNFRQQEAGNYPGDQFDNPQQHSRDPWRGRDFDQDDSYGWNRGDRDFEQQGSRASYGQQGMNQDLGQQGYGQTYGRPQAYGLRNDYSDDTFERNRSAYQGGGFTSGNQRHPIEPSDYQRNYGARRDPGSRSQGNYPDYEATNPPRQYQGGRSAWPETAQQAAEAGAGYTGGRWRSEQQTASLYPDLSLMDYGDSSNRQADYSFGGNRGFGAQGGFAQQGFRGRAPKGYERSDERVREDICERLSQDPHIDASEVTVTVKGGVVTLEGSIDNRQQKHRIEDIADACSGVKDVQNRLSVSSGASSGARQSALGGENRTGSTSETTDKSSSQQKPTRQ